MSRLTPAATQSECRRGNLSRRNQMKAGGARGLPCEIRQKQREAFAQGLFHRARRTRPGDDGNQIGAHFALRILKFAIRNSPGSFPVFILGWTIGENGFNAKTPRRKAAKRRRKLAGDNVPGKMPIDDSSRRDDGNGRMIPPSLQDGFRFGR